MVKVISNGRGRGRGRPPKPKPETVKKRFKPLPKFVNKDDKSDEDESEKTSESEIEESGEEEEMEDSEEEVDQENSSEENEDKEPVVKKFKSGKKEKFSEEVTSYLLDCYSDMQKSFDNPGIMRNKLWEKIAKSRRTVNVVKTSKPIDSIKEEIARSNNLAEERNGLLKRSVETKEKGLQILQDLLHHQLKK